MTEPVVTGGGFVEPEPIPVPVPVTIPVPALVPTPGLLKLTPKLTFRPKTAPKSPFRIGAFPFPRISGGIGGGGGIGFGTGLKLEKDGFGAARVIVNNALVREFRLRGAARARAGVSAPISAPSASLVVGFSALRGGLKAGPKKSLVITSGSAFARAKAFRNRGK